MVPGHEIAGVVAEVGSAVTRFAPGDHVGVGCLVDSCGECEYCQAGEEQFCTKGAVATYNGRGYDGEPTYGGYSQQVVVSDRFVVKIPDSLELADAAPLLCAGITTYVPLKHWKIGKGQKVAIIGMGGLGHVAVKIAAALGAEVTVLSQTLGKQEDGLRFGASHYHATSEKSTFRELAGSFDFILNTVSANLDMDAYLRLLRVDGTLVNVGAPVEPLLGGRVHADRRAAQHGGLGHRRTARHAGDARLLRRARHRADDRADRRGRGGRGLRARGAQRRALPLRDRRSDDPGGRGGGRLTHPCFSNTRRQ